MKQIKYYISEIYLVLAVLYYWTLTASTINWYAIVLLALIGILLFTKNKVFGIGIGAILILINVFLILALISELSEFETFNSKAQELFFFGNLFLGTNLIFSSILLYKYATLTSAKTINIS